MRLTSKDLIDSIVVKHPEIKKKDAIKIVNLYFTELKYAVADGDEVLINNLGKFLARHEPYRTRYNFIQKKSLPSGGHRKPVFRSSRNFDKLM